MVWLFERSDESLKLETRYDNATSEFVAVIHYPDGHATTERFNDTDKFREWLTAFERNVETELWSRHRGGPVFLPDGWPDTPLT